MAKRNPTYQKFFLPAKGNRALVLDVIKRLPIDQSFDIEISDHEEARTLEQNSLAQKICREIAKQYAPNGQKFRQSAWWHLLKRDHWGPEFRMLPDGSVIEVEPQSHKRSKAAFSEFVEFLYARAAEYGVILGDE